MHNGITDLLLPPWQMDGLVMTETSTANHTLSLKLSDLCPVENVPSEAGGNVHLRRDPFIQASLNLAPRGGYIEKILDLPNFILVLLDLVLRCFKHL